MTEKKAQYYDGVFLNDKERFTLHYSKLVYFNMFQEILSFLKKNNINKILELGCGTGQLANYLFDNNVKDYLGIDFSSIAIGKSRKLVPDFNFRQIKFFTDEYDSIVKENYDAYIAIEVLEHIDRDKDLINSLNKGTKIILSLPTFMEESHVRCFKTEKVIRDRFKYCLDIKSCKFFYKVWYLIFAEVK